MGFDKWDKGIHYESEQLKRICSAKKISENNIIDVDTENKKCIIEGNDGTYEVTLEKCDCADFRTRKLPCKHIYLLADVLGELNNLDGLDNLINEYQQQSETNEQLSLLSEEQKEINEALKKEEITLDTLVKGDADFGCCSKYKECSLEGRCVRDDEAANGCSYRNNLKQGKIFYSKKSYLFDQERYDYIVEFYNSLDTVERNAFSELVFYFEYSHRCSDSCLCLYSDSVYNVTKKFNFFEIAPEKELVRKLFQKEIILLQRAEKFQKKYSKREGPIIPKNMESNKKIKVWENYFASDSDLANEISKRYIYIRFAKGKFELNEFFSDYMEHLKTDTYYLKPFSSELLNDFKNALE